jgi:hypothetical protein
MAWYHMQPEIVSHAHCVCRHAALHHALLAQLVALQSWHVAVSLDNADDTQVLHVPAAVAASTVIMKQ